MATNGPKGKGRKGLVAKRSQALNRRTGLWQKRSLASGKWMDIKTGFGKFKGIKTEA